MRLISCHIENFGKLSDRTISFDAPSGITVLCEENGWGKTTLAVFIKVMFFGFDNDGKRNDVENERRHYKPWQGGAYGGQITFEAGGKRYIVSRIFGAKGKDDEVRLVDADTMLESADFSRENIGEELFQIDRTSFSRSFFISQNDCAAGVTDRINAKLGNLADSTDDLNNYETAAKKLSDKLNALSGRRKTGEIYRLREQIGELQQTVRNGAGIDASMEELTAMKNKEHDAYNRLKQEQRDLQEKQRRISAYKDVEMQKKEYARLSKEETEKQRAFEEAGKAFPGRVPEEAVVRSHLEGSIRLLEKGRERDIYRLSKEETAAITKLEQQFSVEAPSKDMIEEMNRTVKEMQTLQYEIEKAKLTEEQMRELKELSVYFAEGTPDAADVDDMMNRWNQRTEKKNVLSAKKATASMLRSAREQKLQGQENESGNAADRQGSTGKTALLSLGLIAAVIGLAVCVKNIVAGGIIAALGILIFLLSFAVKSGDIKGKGSEPDIRNREPEEDAYTDFQKEIAEDEQLIEQVTAEVRQFMQTYHMDFDEAGVSAGLYQIKEGAKKYKQLQEQNKGADAGQLKEQFEHKRDEVRDFLQKYGAAGFLEKEDDYAAALWELQQSAEKYKALREKRDHFAAADGAYNDILAELDAFVTGLSMELQEDIHAQMQSLQEKQRQYMAAEKEWTLAQQAREEFQQKTENFDEIMRTEPEETETSLGDVESRLRKISEQLEEITRNMSAYDRQLDELQEKRDDISETERQLETMQETCADRERKLAMLEKTRDYLEQAKISLTARYTKPIQDGFDKYYRVLAGIAAENYQLDANMDLSFVEQGMPRQIGFLSKGYQDLVGICMRMALVDAMYREEKPFVILDDPFVNLDDERLAGGLKLLKEIAKDYQIIYFTCHETRSISIPSQQ